jgi:glutamate racemase
MKNKKYRKIGFFDSGIGGLTLLKNVKKILPLEDYIYYGDNKNAPYGNKTKKDILMLVDYAFKYFNKKKVKVVVIACNTVTAECVEDLRKKYKFKIIGIEPAIKPAAESGGKSVVLCTKATAESCKFKKLLNKYKDIEVLPQIDLAEIIENNIFNINNIQINKLNEEVKQYKNIVLGCTHYIFLKKFFNNENINIFDGNYGTANNLLAYLTVHNLLNNKGGKIIFKGSGKYKNKKVYKFYLKND